MAGSLTITDQVSVDRASRPVRKVTLAWTSSAGGAVSGNLTDYLSGALVRVVFIPGSGGVQPTDLYDVVLLDGSGLDLLAGQGANLSQSSTTHVCPGVPLKDGTTTSTTQVQIDDQLELQVANAGNAKQGTVVLYLR